MTSFSDLHLAEPLLKALEGEGYTQPTPIQAKAIPPVMEGRDLLGIAQTGTGKTAAFALPILHHLAKDRKPAPRKGCRVLVLSPTRELASQIAESFRAYGRHIGVTVAVVFGGVAHRPQIQTLSRGVDVLVATPGRLLDLMEQRVCDVSGTEIFVLDEADQMLDLGFVKPIRRIVSHLAHRRQNLFFSATMPGEISGLANDLLKDPIKVAVAPVATTAERVRQRVILIEAGKKRSLLAELLADPEMTRTLVFTRTKRGADRVARHLETGGTKVAAIHGNKSQRQREEALDSFRKARINVLVATDIAARGIDIDLVTHVVNFELPEVPEAYVHRIGRTARAGASGIAISLCDTAEREQLRAIERLTRQQIPHEDRRNDPSIVAERTPAHRDDGERTHGGAHRRGADPRRNAEHRGGDRRPQRSAQPHGASDRSSHADRPHTANAHAPARPAHSARPAGDRPRPAADAPRSQQHTPERAHNRDGDAPGSLRDVGFLARPTHGARRDGDRAHGARDGHREGHRDGHRDGHRERTGPARSNGGGGQGFKPRGQGQSRNRDAS